MGLLWNHVKEIITAATIDKSAIQLLILYGCAIH